MPSARPSELELQVLSVLWKHPLATVREVGGALPDGKRRAYTTVLSVLQVMEKKGLATHASRGTSHLWRAAVSRRQVLGPILRGLVRNAFGGDAADAVMHLLRETEVDGADLAQIREMLDQAAPSRPSSKEKKPR